MAGSVKSEREQAVCGGIDLSGTDGNFSVLRKPDDAARKESDSRAEWDKEIGMDERNCKISS